VAGARPTKLRLPQSEQPNAAGTPIDVVEALDRSNVREMLEVDPRLLGRWADHPDDLFALPVKGQSMIDALIADGDIVIMAKQETAHDGETVAVWLEAEQETTLKHFWREGENQVRLQPANTSMAPILTTADNIKIMGRVVSVLRRCD
jgi:repressor LexA